MCFNIIVTKKRNTYSKKQWGGIQVMSEQKFQSIWENIKPYVTDDKNSLILLFGDKYYGKTEMLNYFIKNDKNTYRYLIENTDIQDDVSLVRICFFKLLTTIYIEDKPQLVAVINMVLGIRINDAEGSYADIYNELQKQLSNYDTQYLQKIIDSIFVEKIVINYYIGCYQFFRGFDNDIKYMNNLNTKISFNFIIATRPCDGEMNTYLGKFSNVRYFELITKKLEPITYKIVGENKYYKMPIYDRFLEEIGIDYSFDTNEILKSMSTNEYFKKIDDEIGYGFIDSEDLLLISLIMAAGCLDRQQIEFIFKIIETQKNIAANTFVKHYEFMCELQGKIFSSSTWSDFIFYSRYNDKVKQQLDSFFSTVLYSIFMEVPVRGTEISIESLRELLRTKKDYSFFIDGNISEAYQLLLSLAVSYKKHKADGEGFLSNPANVEAVDFLSKYVLAINEQTLDFVEKLFNKTLNYNLLITYTEAIEKYIKNRYSINCGLERKMKIFLSCVFKEADKWSDITLFTCGLNCLDAMITNTEWTIADIYDTSNIGYEMIVKIIEEKNLSEVCMEKFKDFNSDVDILIVIATQEEEEAIISNDVWKRCENLKYAYFVHREKGITFALARGIDKGGENAGISATFFVENLKPRAITMVGFAAGREGEVSLGDIVIGKRIFNYDVGKKIGKDDVLHEIDAYKICDKWKPIAERFGEDWRESINVNLPKQYEEQEVDLLHEFDTSFTINTNIVYDKEKYPAWKTLIENLQEKEYISIASGHKLKITAKGKEHINRYDILHPDGYENREPKTQIGVIATGCKVNQYDDIFDEIAKQDRSVCALEMEGTAIGKVSGFEEIPFLIVKGIGDYAQTDKKFQNRFIEYACVSSYRFVVEFFTSEEMIGKF